MLSRTIQVTLLAEIARYPYFLLLAFFLCASAISVLGESPRCSTGWTCRWPSQKWLRKSEQGDKWNRCLIEGMIVLSETGARDEQTTPP